MIDVSAREKATNSIRSLFLFAGLLVVLSVSFGGLLLFSVVNDFNRTVDSASTRSREIEIFSTLDDSLREMGTPANDIFVSRDAGAERARLVFARQKFDATAAEGRARVSALSDGAARREAEKKLDRVSRSAGEVERLARETLDEFEQGREAGASRRLTYMNRELAMTKQLVSSDVQKSLESQMALLETEHAAALRTRGLGNALALLSLLALVAILSVSRRFGQRLIRLAKEREETMHLLERNAFELQMFNRRLTESNRDLTDFAYVASHDLQEPLRKIIAFGDRLHRRCHDELGDDGRDYLMRVRNAAERMQVLIEDLLTFSRVTTRGDAFVATELNEVLAGVVDDLEVAIEHAEATVDIGTMPVIDVDPLQFRQLMQNLLGNALKFRRVDVATYIGVRAVRVAPEQEAELDARYPEAGGWWSIEVRDNGVGFEQKYAEKIFTVFQRLHGRTAYEGSGVGLAVCRRIVERHHGEICAFSNPGAGSTFRVTLPTRQVELPTFDESQGPRGDEVAVVRGPATAGESVTARAGVTDAGVTDEVRIVLKASA